MYRRTIAIGPLAVTCMCDDRSFDALIARDYKMFLSPRHTGLPVRIMPLTSPSTDDLAVTANRRGITIARDDFHSRSDAAFTLTDLYIHRDTYSLNSWLRIFLTLAGLRRGILLVHGAGWRDGTGAWLFAGRSGAGKSTITRILGKRHALSDELTLLHHAGAGTTAYSTPFWGELQRGGEQSRRGALRGICSLRHGAAVDLTPAARPHTLRTLLSTILFFSDNAGLMRRLLATAAAITRTTPGYTLTFSRDARPASITRTLREAVA